jgi:hypothetical protein
VYFQRNKPHLLDNLHRKTNLSSSSSGPLMNMTVNTMIPGAHSGMLSQSYPSQQSSLLQTMKQVTSFDSMQQKRSFEQMNDNDPSQQNSLNSLHYSKYSHESFPSFGSGTNTTGLVISPRIIHGMHLAGSSATSTSSSYSSDVSSLDSSYHKNRNHKAGAGAFESVDSMDSSIHSSLSSSSQKSMMILETRMLYRTSSIDSSSFDSTDPSGASSSAAMGQPLVDVHEHVDYVSIERNQLLQGLRQVLTISNNSNSNSNRDYQQWNNAQIKDFVMSLLQHEVCLIVVDFMFDHDPRAGGMMEKIFKLVSSYRCVAAAVDGYMAAISPCRLSIVKLLHGDGTAHEEGHNSSPLGSHQNAPAAADKVEVSLSRKLAIVRSFIAFSLFILREISSYFESEGAIAVDGNGLDSPRSTGEGEIQAEELEGILDRLRSSVETRAQLWWTLSKEWM